MAQDVFLAAWRDLAKLRNPASFLTLFYREGFFALFLVALGINQWVWLPRIVERRLQAERREWERRACCSEFSRLPAEMTSTQEPPRAPG